MGRGGKNIRTFTIADLLGGETPRGALPAAPVHSRPPLRRDEDLLRAVERGLISEAARPQNIPRAYQDTVFLAASARLETSAGRAFQGWIGARPTPDGMRFVGIITTGIKDRPHRNLFEIHRDRYLAETVDEVNRHLANRQLDSSKRYEAVPGSGPKVFDVLDLVAELRERAMQAKLS